MNLMVQHFFDKVTSTLTYVVYDKDTRDGVVIDPVWDYDQGASRLSQESFKKVYDYIIENKINLHYVLETHAHADHISSSQLFKKAIPTCKVAINKNIDQVQKVFKPVFNLSESFKVDGSQFDVLLNENELLVAGSLKIKTIFTPGHTPACSSIVIEDCVFTGDTLFMPDSGTGRCDFPSGSAEMLFESITKKLYTLPDAFKVYVGHDYQPNGRELQFMTTIENQKLANIHIKSSTEKNQYVDFRTARDKTLSAPKLLLPSIQINIDAGLLPQNQSNGKKYLNIPIKEDL